MTPRPTRPLWPYPVPPGVIVAALLSTVWLPFVNTATLWFGLPSVGVWTVLWVLAITPALALLEFSGRRPGRCSGALVERVLRGRREPAVVGTGE
ncbi:MAG TPA: hypothetical protein VD903_03315 [Pseudonocardia sp.]|nr:hypothetical protein [Pseudonocardia sp.]